MGASSATGGAGGVSCRSGSSPFFSTDVFAVDFDAVFRVRVVFGLLTFFVLARGGIQKCYVFKGADLLLRSPGNAMGGPIFSSKPYDTLQCFGNCFRVGFQSPASNRDQTGRAVNSCQLCRREAGVSSSRQPSFTMNDVPSPGWLDTSMLPLCASTMALQIASPNPLRPSARLREASAR